MDSIDDTLSTAELEGIQLNIKQSVIVVGNKMGYCASNLRRFRDHDSQPLAYGRCATNIEGMDTIVGKMILPGDKRQTS